MIWENDIRCGKDSALENWHKRESNEENTERQDDRDSTQLDDELEKQDKHEAKKKKKNTTKQASITLESDTIWKTT